MGSPARALISNPALKIRACQACSFHVIPTFFFVFFLGGIDLQHSDVDFAPAVPAPTNPGEAP